MPQATVPKEARFLVGGVTLDPGSSSIFIALENIECFDVYF